MTAEAGREERPVRAWWLGPVLGVGVASWPVQFSAHARSVLGVWHRLLVALLSTAALFVAYCAMCHARRARKHNA
eukprot:CAMPEP_0196686470 /NCGR_PEP_ID=MMETSP1090-20130531/12602_1 /TAXON_ID=37098 /ORGANISM="Isochrysis sp, Strain CCMP1244" /LENGTH=74 /DNA_ID=CAMNT_0042025093 /DNA_START=1 /DNA_END=225 /DNA_ORIENTATION=-